MRLLIKFEEQGYTKYISHLDLQRAMQRALLRSGLPVLWSQGYHPHQQFTFAMALPVGVSSMAEYMEIQLEDGYEGDVLHRLNHSLPPGLRAYASCEIPTAAPSLMALVAASDWLMRLDNVSGDMDAIETLLGQSRIMVQKKGKSGTRTVDIRPGILSLESLPAVGENILILKARLAAGSKLNIQPVMLLDALADNGLVWEVADINRQELYADNKGELCSLDQYFQEL